LRSGGAAQPHVPCGALWTGLCPKRAAPETLPCKPRSGGSGSTPPGAQLPAQPSGKDHPTPRGGNCHPKGDRSGTGRPAGAAATAGAVAAAAATDLRATTPPGGGHPTRVTGEGGETPYGGSRGATGTTSACTAGKEPES